MTLSIYKPAQPLALQKLKRKYDMERKNEQKRKVSKSTLDFFRSAEELVIKFGSKSTVHGMNRIFLKGSNKFERMFWISILFTAILGSVYVCQQLSQRFSEGTLQTVVDSTDMPVFLVAFPEISICNVNQLNWQRLEEAKRSFIPQENNTETIRMFERVIGLYDNITFGEFHSFKALKEQPLDLVNHINFSLVLDFMTWRCDELLTNCLWREAKYNCCDIFLKSRGQNGLCWHFNTLSTVEGRARAKKDDKYPWRTGSSGPKTGLSLRVMIHEEKHFRRDNDKGIMVGVMEPGVFYRDPTFVPSKTETMVEVQPAIYFYDNDTKILSAKQRQCRFNTDHSKSLAGFKYKMENCHAQCHQEYMLKYCNCTLDIMFPPADYRSCQVKDLLCLAKYNNYFRFTHQIGEESYVRSRYPGMDCQCFHSCYSRSYATDVRSSFLPAYRHKNRSFVDLDVHFRLNTIMVYRTKLVFGWVDLIAGFGGIVGLFLGCSLVSSVELMYFLFFELPLLIYRDFVFKAKSIKIAQSSVQNNLKTFKG